MQTTYFGDSNQYATLTADEGYWLTTWNETDDISTFNAFKIVRLLSERTGLFQQKSKPWHMPRGARDRLGRLCKASPTSHRLNKDVYTKSPFRVHVSPICTLKAQIVNTSYFSSTLVQVNTLIRQ